MSLGAIGAIAGAVNPFGWLAARGGRKHQEKLQRRDIDAEKAMQRAMLGFQGQENAGDRAHDRYTNDRSTDQGRAMNDQDLFMAHGSDAFNSMRGNMSPEQGYDFGQAGPGTAFDPEEGTTTNPYMKGGRMPAKPQPQTPPWMQGIGGFAGGTLGNGFRY